MNHENDNRRTFISMFSGIEAASQAFPQWEAICFSEIEKFPSAVLAYHYPDVPNVGDMTQHDWTQYRGKVDIVCGGPPCQAFSIAGLRNSMADARGNLSLSYMRALHAIKPRNAIVENVPGWLSTSDNAFGCFLAGLVGVDAPLVSPLKRGRWPDAGMVAGPEGRAAWRILDAQYFGLAQRRRRVIVVADFGNGADPAAVLFEPEGLRRDTPPSRETGEGVAGATKGGAGGGGQSVAWSIMPQNSGKDYKARQVEVAQPIMAGGPVGGNQGGDYIQQFAPEIARCVATREGSSQDYESTTMVAQTTAFTAKDYGGDAAYDIAPTLRAGTHSGSHANAGVMPAVTVAIRGREGGATAELGGEVATALRASQGGGDKPHVLAFGWQNSEHQGDSVDEHITPTLDKSKTPAVLQSAVRRLTPVECERLMGFPDNYTAIQWRGKPASECPDGPRYKALGNSWAVPLFTWLGRRIDKHMPPIAANDNEQEASLAAV